MSLWYRWGLALGTVAALVVIRTCRFLGVSAAGEVL